MSEINLLQTQSTISAVKATSQRWILRLLSLVLVILILVYAYFTFMSWNNSKKISTLRTEIIQVQSELSESKDRGELITRQGQLNEVNQLLQKHLYWSVFLPELSRVTLASTQYTNIDLDEKGNLDLTATFPSYQEAEKYLQVFNLPEYHKYFSNVKILSLVKTQQDNLLKTTMRLNLTVSPELMKK